MGSVGLAPASGGGVTVSTSSVEQAANFTTTSSTRVSITNFNMTIPDITDGKCVIVCNIRGETNYDGEVNAFFTNLDDDGSVIGYASLFGTFGAGYTDNAGLCYVMDADGSTITGQLYADGSATAKSNGGSYSRSVMYALGVG